MYILVKRDTYMTEGEYTIHGLTSCHVVKEAWDAAGGFILCFDENYDTISAKPLLPNAPS